MQSSLEYFVDLLGEENILRPGVTKAEKMQDYLKDEGDYPSEPLIGLPPQSTDQVAKIVSWADSALSDSGTGRRHKFDWSVFSPWHDSHRFYRMKNPENRRRELVHSRRKLASCLKIERRAEKIWLFLSFRNITGSTPSCTVGGAIAGNYGGMKCFRYQVR